MVLWHFIHRLSLWYYSECEGAVSLRHINTVYRLYSVMLKNLMQCNYLQYVTMLRESNEDRNTEIGYATSAFNKLTYLLINSRSWQPDNYHQSSSIIVSTEARTVEKDLRAVNMGFRVSRETCTESCFGEDNNVETATLSTSLGCNEDESNSNLYHNAKRWSFLLFFPFFGLPWSFAHCHADGSEQWVFFNFTRYCMLWICVRLRWTILHVL